MAVVDVKSKLQSLAMDESSALNELLEANGLEKEQLFNTAELQQITHLEMFLHYYPRMLGLNMFPYLRTLALIHQDIKEISGLEECTHLEKLWIVENDVKQIRGLDKLVNLKELYLHSNRIVKIEGLRNLTNLEVLWLSDNYITTIEGISHLVRLRELQLARNDIECVGDALSHNTALEVLNLADNNIGSFKEVRPLARLPRLVDLCFADPMWGECPLAGLCNYQTYVLYTLPKLTSLDTLLLADETKQLAEATFLKKQMYYNMRIKTMHRNARNIIKLANEGKKAKLQLRRPMINRLVLQLKDIQRELEEAAQYGGSGSPWPARVDDATLEALRAKLDSMHARLAKYSQEVSDADAYFEECASRTYQVVQGHVSRMLLELDTAGNIRLEEGRPTDLWYTSCVDLLHSRFNTADFDSSQGVTGVNVLRVTRIHNRWLRNRFEKQLSSQVDMSDAGYKRSMEYLFLGDHPALPGEMERIVEDGMRPAAQLAAMGLDGAVLLSNNVCLADQLRLMSVVEQRSSGAGGSAWQSFDQPAIGRLMIVKAYLGRTAQDSVSLGSGRSASQQLYGKDGKLVVASTLEGPRITRQGGAFANVDAVYRTRPGETKQRLWYVFDNVMVLPEYLVEFQYELSPSSQLAPRRTGNSSSAPAGGKASGGTAIASLQDLPLSVPTVQNILNSLEPELRPLARPLMSWLALHFDEQVAQQVACSPQEESEVNTLLEAPPHVAARAKLYTMNDEMIGKHLQGLSLSGLAYLNLHSCALRKIENLSSLRDLKVLVLTYNDITRMEGLAELSGLQRLDLGHNLIRKVEGLKGLSSLQHLDMSSNQVSKLEEIYGLKKYVPQLTYLDMSDNPLCEDKSYRPTVLRKLKSLVKFDALDVSPEEKAAYGENAGALPLQMVLEHGAAGHRLGMSDTGLNAGVPGPALEATQIQELVLERKRIRRLQNLHQLVNLRVANFADNQISHIEGLECCTALEELCLEDNRIAQIEGLAACTRLKKLQLGKNRLSSIEVLSGMTSLTQLSVEDNELTSLSGVEQLTQLMELYAGNNRLQEMREVQRLRELPKIIILDLSGNPCTAGTDDYRLYVIYNVRKLKVLDGMPIDAAEQAAAKSKYSGRLTLDFLEEKLGHRMFDRIRDLDVSGLKVRDVGTVFLGEEFECLQELNLDSNMLVDVSGLALLRQLVVLKLNSNRLGEECTFNPRRMIEKNPELYKALTDPQRAHEGGSSLSAFELFPYIQVLQLGGNQVASISSLQLSSLTSLRTLFLNNNDITRIDGLEGLANLQELVLDRNRIRYIDPDAFTGLPRLRELRLEENGLRSLASLTSLTSLQALHLGFNRIGDASDLDRLTGLVSLVEINLVNNPITRKPNYRLTLVSRCPRLQVADGQAVAPEERDYADALVAQQQQQADAGPGMPKQQPVAIRMTNVDFGGLVAGGPYQFPGANSVPSIQSNTLVLSGPGGLGLEGVGVGLRDGFGGYPGGGLGAMQVMDPMGGRDMWGRPTSNDKRGMMMPGKSPMKDGAGMGPGGPAARGSASPARRQALMAGHRAGMQQGGFRGGYG